MVEANSIIMEITEEDMVIDSQKTQKVNIVVTAKIIEQSINQKKS
jgi:lipopolysaccharide export system protein LptA